ncbi:MULTISPECIES: hypothetical protein [unclassified Streptomyces]|nr:hypothetical protein OG395_13760 [Streptomyces sp. NBC_01320]
MPQDPGQDDSIEYPLQEYFRDVVDGPWSTGHLPQGWNSTFGVRQDDLP